MALPPLADGSQGRRPQFNWVRPSWREPGVAESVEAVCIHGLHASRQSDPAIRFACIRPGALNVTPCVEGKVRKDYMEDYLMPRASVALRTAKPTELLPLFPVREPGAMAAAKGSCAAPQADFLSRVKRFDGLGAKTASFDESGIPYLVNEFWTAGQRQANSIHEVSYRACFKAQLPEFFIDGLTAPGEAVHDPFMGRGTTPIQAALMGRRPVGNDINPLSVLLTRPRLQPPSLQDLEKRLQTVPWDEGEIDCPDLLAFYHPSTLQKLTSLKAWLLQRAPLEDPSPDPIDDWIRMVSLNRLTGHSPGFFSGRTMPPNQAVSVAAQLKMNAKSGMQPPPRDLISIILKKSKSLLSDGAPPPHPPAQFSVGLAAETAHIPAASISLTVTSPPFLDIVHYADDNWLRCWFSGIDVNAIAIGMHRTESAWSQMVRDVLLEQSRIIKLGGHVAFEVGEVRGGKILLERLVWAAADGLPFEKLAVLVNQQEFTKTANCWGVSNNKSGTNTNRIVLLRRV